MFLKRLRYAPVFYVPDFYREYDKKNVSRVAASGPKQSSEKQFGFVSLTITKISGQTIAAPH